MIAPDPAPGTSGPAIIVPGHYVCWKLTSGQKLILRFCEYKRR